MTAMPVVAGPIWSGLIGQDEVVQQLAHAVVDAEALRRGERGPAMTHAWLITGPPGSGRSTAATSFAAALACPDQGCGTCQACRMGPAGGHPDVHVVVAQGLSYGVDDARELVRQSSLSPVESPWNVFVIEDADRFTDEAVRALLKAIEEPPPHVVWILCAPSLEDVEPTIASRTRHVSLRTPTTASVARVLQEAYGIDAAMATFAARASQGHIGRARALATDEHARRRRQEVLRVPFELRDVPSCMAQAAVLMEAATDDARTITDALDEAENSQLQAAYGAGAEGVTKGRVQRLMSRDQKELADTQKSRAKRVVVDQVDRVVIDLMGLYRDVLVLQVGADVELINAEMHPQLQTLAERSSQADTGRRLAALAHARQQLRANVAPILLLESLMVELRDPWIRTVPLG